MKYIKSLLTACLFLCAVAVNAHDFEVNGIYYNITDETNKTVAVTYNSDYYYFNKYSGCVVIPDSVNYNGNTYSVTSIGSSAFSGCSALTSVTIPNSVTNIGDLAFGACSSLTDFIIPNSVTKIKWCAFNRCTSLKNLCIEDGEDVLSMEGGGTYKGLFYDCPLERLYLGRDLSYISEYTDGYSPFYKKTTLTSLTIGNCVKSIGYAMFARCTGLTSVTIGNGVANIGEYAFSDCTSLVSVIIPNCVTSVECAAFQNCISLKDLCIEDGEDVLSMEKNEAYEGLFYDCPLERLYLGRDLSYISEYTDGYSPFFKKTTLISLTIGNCVTSIGDNAFYECHGLTSVEIPNSVTSIGKSAFVRCSGLTSITIGNSVTGIGDNAFYECHGLTSITIGNGVTSIGDLTFSGCSNLEKIKLNCIAIDNWFSGYTSIKEVIIGDCVESIGDSAFSGCYGLANVTIGNSVKSIGSSAFSECGITSITIPCSVTSIGSCAFLFCVGLTRVEIPNSITSIGDYAFWNCWCLTSIEIPNSVTSIGNNAFEGCSGITSITIGNGVTSIGDNAFDECSGVESITVDANNAKYDSRENCNAIILTSTNTLITGCENTFIPDDVTSIGMYAFSGCSGLTGVIIPNSVTSIGCYAFSGCCRLETVINLSPLSITKGSNDYGYIAYYAKNVINVSECSVVDDFVFDVIDSVNVLCCYLGNDKELILPGDYKGENYVIGASAFSNSCELTSIVIPNSVTSIRKYAFDNCKSLKSLCIEDGDSILSLQHNGSDKGLFCDTPLKILYMGRDLSYESVKEYGFSPFYNISALSQVSISNGVTNIGRYMFCNCSGLLSITIPCNVTLIGENAFEGCSELKTVVNLSELDVVKGSMDNGYVAYYADKVINAPNGSIEGDFVFGKLNDANALVAYLGNEKDLVLPISYKGENYKIDTAAFKNDTSITSVTIGDSVTSIGTNTFYGCTGLANVTIPNSVTNIGNGAFNGCTSLKELCIEDGEDVLTLGYNDVDKGLFYDCPLKTVYIGRSLSYEKDSLSGTTPFYGIETLASVGIGAPGLDENLFDGCQNINNVGFNTEVVPSIFANHVKVSDVTLSGCVKVVSDGAFVGMDKLTNVVLETPVPPAISSAAFEKLHYKLLYVYLLDGCTPIYQASEIWKNFLDIQEFAPDGAGVNEASNVWRNYWDIPEYIIPEDEIEESILSDVLQFERVSDGVRLPAAKGKHVTVYTFGGSLIKNVSGYSGETIALDKGAYIIVADSDALQIVL